MIKLCSVQTINVGNICFSLSFFIIALFAMFFTPKPAFCLSSSMDICRF